MEDLISTIVSLIIFVALPLLLKAFKGKSAPTPKPVRRPAKAEKTAGENEGGIDLSFLENTFEALGIEIPEEYKEELGAGEAKPPGQAIDAHPGHAIHPRALAAPAYEAAAAFDDGYDIPAPDAAYKPVAGGSEGFFAGLDVHRGRATGHQPSVKGEFWRDAVVLQSIFTPHKRL